MEVATAAGESFEEAADDDAPRAPEGEAGSEPAPGGSSPVPSDDESELPTGVAQPEDDGTPEPGAEDPGDTGPVMIDELEEPAGYDPVGAPPEMSQMLFVDVVLLLPATHPVVVLQEADAPFRELRIPVGGAEGIAIGYAARQVATPRPLTHELVARMLEEFQMTLDVVRITDVQGSSFTAEMVVSGPTGSRVIDCRPSDAIALALRQRLPAPIMASPMVLALAGTDPLGAN